MYSACFLHPQLRPPYLPSFPTRRSSDLDLLGIPWIQAPAEGEAQASAMARTGVAYAAASQDFDSLLFGSPRLVKNLAITGRDRKSTRLNSSHRTISYAVFCLKKKKTECI